MRPSIHEYVKMNDDEEMINQKSVWAEFAVLLSSVNDIKSFLNFCSCIELRTEVWMNEMKCS